MTKQTKKTQQTQRTLDFLLEEYEIQTFADNAGMCKQLRLAALELIDLYSTEKDNSGLEAEQIHNLEKISVLLKDCEQLYLACE